VAQGPSVELNQKRERLRIWVAKGLARFAVLYRSLTWKNLKAAVGASVSNAAKLIWIGICILIIVYIVRDLSSDLVVIEPISVPKTFSESGFVPEVASRRLRDALSEYAIKAGTAMQIPSVAPRGELPSIIVPKLDISLDTIISSIRSVLHYGSRHSISGEIILRSKLAWLRLRIDGKLVHSSQNGFDLETIDDLFAAAVPAVMDEIRPYLVAVTTYRVDPKKAAQKADDMIARLPIYNVNVQWAYVLKGNFFNEQKNVVQAEKAYRKAISLNEKNYVAHTNLGTVLGDLDKNDEALKEFLRAIEIEPKYALAHDGLGSFLIARGKLEEAIAEYRLAIACDPRDAIVRHNLGAALHNKGELDDAIVEYRRAIDIDPKLSTVRTHLAAALHKQGKLDEAIEEYRYAIEIDPKDEHASDGLESALLERNSRASTSN
jgi:Tfp pilus assembly protein PilF